MALPAITLGREWNVVLALLDNVAYAASPRLVDRQRYEQIRGQLSTLMQRHVNMQRAVDQASNLLQNAHPDPPRPIPTPDSMPGLVESSSDEGPPLGSPDSDSDDTNDVDKKKIRSTPKSKPKKKR